MGLLDELSESGYADERGKLAETMHGGLRLIVSNSVKIEGTDLVWDVPRKVRWTHLPDGFTPLGYLIQDRRWHFGESTNALEALKEIPATKKREHEPPDVRSAKIFEFAQNFGPAWLCGEHGGAHIHPPVSGPETGNREKEGCFWSGKEPISYVERMARVAKTCLRAMARFKPLTASVRTPPPLRRSEMEEFFEDLGCEVWYMPQYLSRPSGKGKTTFRMSWGEEGAPSAFDSIATNWPYGLTTLEEQEDFFTQFIVGQLRREILRPSLRPVLLLPSDGNTNGRKVEVRIETARAGWVGLMWWELNRLLAGARHVLICSVCGTPILRRSLSGLSKKGMKLIYCPDCRPKRPAQI